MIVYAKYDDAMPTEAQKRIKCLITTLSNGLTAICREVLHNKIQGYARTLDIYNHSHLLCKTRYEGQQYSFFCRRFSNLFLLTSLRVKRHVPLFDDERYKHDEMRNVCNLCKPDWSHAQIESCRI